MDLIKKIIISSVFAVLVTTSATANESCTNVPASESGTAVRACETDEIYTFHINGVILEYDKEIYQRDLRSLFRSWLENTYLNEKVLVQARIDLVLSVPELNPSATQMRAVLTSPEEKFVFFLSVRPDEWSLNTLTVSILDEGETYPQVYGYRAGSLIIEMKDGASESQFQDHLATFGIQNVESFSENWYRADVAVFSESETIDNVNSRYKSKAYIDSIQTNSIVEWISLREYVFSFNLGL
jgi:hypothetical protein